MKAFGTSEIKDVGDYSGLKEFDVPKPQPKGKDLLVEIKAVATNPVDYVTLAGLMGKMTVDKDIGPDKPHIVGWDAAGIVTEVGDDTSLT